MNGKYIIYSIFLMMATVLTGCNDDGCTLNNIVLARYGFYKPTGEGVIQATALSGTLTVRAFGTDSILVNQEQGARGLTLPMSYYHDADTLVLEYFDETLLGRDTIIVGKSNTPHHESVDCPTAMFHVITGAQCTRHVIDTVLVIKPTVNYQQDENIRIVFATSD